MNNFTSQPTKQKDDFFMSTYFKLIMIVLLTVTVLTACGDGSDKLPKIISVTFLEEVNRIVVDATDDVKVTGYLLTKLDGEPKLDDSTWRQSNVFNDISGSGTFNVWVKDVDNNLATSEIVIEDPIVALAKEYEFLQWYLDDATTKTVDGVAYDLSSLKQQYGDLYRFVEPLSKEEVEYRFKYLAEYYAARASEGYYDDHAGGVKIETNEVDFAYSSKVRSYYEPLYKKDFDENIDKYSKYYMYAEKTNRYYEDIPESMYYKDEFYLYTIINVIDSIPFEDKDWFLRAYMYKLDTLLSTFKNLNIRPSFEISLSGENE